MGIIGVIVGLVGGRCTYIRTREERHFETFLRQFVRIIGTAKLTKTKEVRRQVNRKLWQTKETALIVKENHYTVWVQLADGFAKVKKRRLLTTAMAGFELGNRNV